MESKAQNRQELQSLLSFFWPKCKQNFFSTLVGYRSECSVLEKLKTYYAIRENLNTSQQKNSVKNKKTLSSDYCLYKYMI